jgi:DNA-directed RNA polymerase subunit RPC12/RpoP
MSDDDEATIKRIARETYNVFVNEGGMVRPEELRAVGLAEEGFICESCSRPVLADQAACRCGHRRAVSGDDAAYKCIDCNSPIADPSTKSCPSCRGLKVTRADPSFKYECLECGEGVDPSWPSCKSCGETRCIERPVQTVET